MSGPTRLKRWKCKRNGRSLHGYIRLKTHAGIQHQVCDVAHTATKTKNVAARAAAWEKTSTDYGNVIKIRVVRGLDTLRQLQIYKATLS